MKNQESSYQSGKLFIISSVAGGGKSTLISMLLKKYPTLQFSISSTTRSPRLGDIPGTSYNFIDVPTFEDGIQKDEFLEWAKVHGNYYGTPRTFINSTRDQGKDVVLDIDVQGAKIIKEKISDSVSIFILPPSEDVWIQRLKGRGSDSEESIQKRIINGKKELLEQDNFDYKIVNDDLESAFNQLEKIVIR